MVRCVERKTHGIYNAPINGTYEASNSNSASNNSGRLPLARERGTSKLRYARSCSAEYRPAKILTRV